nr:hypothetical protein [Pyrinomonadaceae bacterium]
DAHPRRVHRPELPRTPVVAASRRERRAIAKTANRGGPLREAERKELREAQRTQRKGNYFCGGFQFIWFIFAL